MLVHYLLRTGMGVRPGLAWGAGRVGLVQGAGTGSRPIVRISGSAFAGPGCLRRLILPAS